MTEKLSSYSQFWTDLNEGYKKHFNRWKKAVRKLDPINFPEETRGYPNNHPLDQNATREDLGDIPTRQEEEGLQESIDHYERTG